MAFLKTLRGFLLVISLSTIAALAAVIAFGLGGGQQSAQALADAVDRMSSLRASMQGDMMHDAIRADVLAAINAGNSGDLKAKAAIFQDLEAHRSSFLQAMASLERHPDPQVQAQLKATLPSVNAYLNLATQAVNQAFDPAINSRSTQGFFDAFAQLEDEMARLGDQVQNQASQAARQSQEAQNATQIGFFAAALVALLTAGLGLFLFYRKLTRTLGGEAEDIASQVDLVAQGQLTSNSAPSGLTEAAGIQLSLDRMRRSLAEKAALIAALANGDLTQTSRPASASDQLHASLAQLLSGLNISLAAISQAADTVAANSRQVSGASQTLSDMTSSQAAALEEISASLTEVVRQSADAVQLVSQTDDLSRHAAAEAGEGSRVMSELQTAMSEISSVIGTINQVVNTIDDIAFQTNLLSLNANVEAARAGQYGKGFGVVAEEVRALAQRSAASVRDTSRLVAGSLAAIERGQSLVETAVKNLSEITRSVADIASRVTQIRRDSADTSQRLGQIGDALNQIDRSTQANAATSEQAAAAAQELDHAVSLVRERLARFQLASPTDSSPLRLSSR